MTTCRGKIENMTNMSALAQNFGLSEYFSRLIFWLKQSLWLQFVTKKDKLGRNKRYEFKLNFFVSSWQEVVFRCKSSWWAWVLFTNGVQKVSSILVNFDKECLQRLSRHISIQKPDQTACLAVACAVVNLTSLPLLFNALYQNRIYFLKNLCTSLLFCWKLNCEGSATRH